MLKKSMLLLALLVSPVVADDCCNAEEVKAENVACCENVACPMKMEDPKNCIKEELKKSETIQGCKVSIKLTTPSNGQESSVEAYLPNDVEVNVAPNGEDACIRMMISSVDNDKVCVKACTLAMDAETQTVVPQGEVTCEVAVGTPAEFAWENVERPVKMELIVLEMCSLDLTDNQEVQ